MANQQTTAPWSPIQEIPGMGGNNPAYPLISNGGNLPANPLISQQTGGNYPASITSAPVMGGSLPPSLQNTGVPSMGGNLPPELLQVMQTGGNLPPEVLVAMQTGGNLPPEVVPNQVTGGNLPPGQFNEPAFGGGLQAQALSQMTGGNLPPNVANVPGMGGNLPPNVVPPANGGNGQALGLEQYSPYNVVNGLVNAFSDSNGSYVQNARRRGLEAANRRGLLNSSIAAGSSERAALESIAPFVQQGVGLLNDRENRALQKTMQQDEAVLQDWLNSNQFTRQFNSTLSLLPITNAYDLIKNVTQYGLENPEVYTPDIISGTSNFFTKNMFDIIGQYFPNLVNRGGA